ncbi:MAG TPA: hypothetical protein ENK56_00990 [Chloroflexi bacterium]|nr:hypothetical protein [Chloroflexota bacterium]
MNPEGIQRTLMVGLGEGGAHVVAASLARLRERLASDGVVAGLAVQVAEADEPPPLSATLTISPETPFARWQEEFEAMVGPLLRRVSRLDHLTALVQQGLSLRRAGEVHLILVADLAEPWVGRTLMAVAGALRASVHRTLACDAGLTGLLLLPPAAESDPPCPGKPLPGAGEVAGDGPGNPFDRGCFLVSPTNEAGLVVGDSEALIHRTAHFLALLVTSPLGAAVAESDWDPAGPSGWEPSSLASFGLAAIRWPGPALVEALSARWAGELLARLTASIPGVEEEADAAARRWAAGERLAPSFLLERLSTLAPAPPNPLADGVPDPPWPWELVGLRERLEAAVRRWEEAWQATDEALTTALAEARATWREAARRWLDRQLASPAEGALRRIGARLEAVARLLRAFVEEVEAGVEEAHRELEAVEEQLAAAAEALSRHLAPLPGSPLAALLRWGSHPLRWPRRWGQCRWAQDLARHHAHLLRARLVALRTLRLHERALPCYRAMQAAWAEVLEAWACCSAQVIQAAGSPTLAGWQEQQQAALESSGGPWTPALVEALYEAAEDLEDGPLWDPPGPLRRWMEEGTPAEEIEGQLRDHAAGRLRPRLLLPVDLALARQMADEAHLADWLAAFVAQASPFLRYDETALTEESRARTRLDRWLLLPGGERSPLARLCQRWSQPPLLLESQEPGEMIAVTVRRRAVRFGADSRQRSRERIEQMEEPLSPFNPLS